MLWPGDSSRWRAVFHQCGKCPDSPIARTILTAFADAGGNPEEGLALGADWEMKKGPIALTRGFAEALPGDSESNTRRLPQDRKAAAMRRTARKQWGAIG